VVAELCRGIKRREARRTPNDGETRSFFLIEDAPGTHVSKGKSPASTDRVMGCCAFFTGGGPLRVPKNIRIRKRSDACQAIFVFVTRLQITDD
jgi:hypothetical protein